MHCKICDKSFTGLVCFQQHEASEKHKKKVKLYQDANGASQGNSTANHDLLLIPCTVCEIKLTGMLNFQAHVNSLQHAEMVKKKNEGNIFPNDQSESKPNEPDNTQVNNIDPSSNTPFYFSNAAVASYAQCEVCQKQFSGPAPYQQHLVSEPHRKKCILKGVSIVAEDQLRNASTNPATVESKNEINCDVPVYLPNPALGSFAQCDVCQKQFSGPAPYQQHLVSEVHKKKCIQRGISIVPENQSKSASNEEGKDEVNPVDNVSLNLSTPGMFAECKVCQKHFSGRAPYEQHLASELHKKKVFQNELSSVNFDTVDSDKISFVNQQEKVSNIAAPGTIPPFAECKSCNMQFSGREPYQLHLDSAGHQKKIAVERSATIQLPKSTYGVASSLKCVLCDKDFSGPVPYNDHLDSKGHKKKVQNVEVLKTFKSSVYPEPDSSTPAPNYITEDVKVNNAKESSGINQKFYCEVCNVQMSGPEPYRQHIFGEMHRKNSNSQNVNNPDKKGFQISKDLILVDALQNIGVVRPEDLNVAIFYPEDEIVFDNTMKRNNFNDKIILELNCE